MNSDSADLQVVAAACVSLVASQFNRHLDGSLDSLAELDTVCAELLADGPLDEQRLDLWWKLIGAYTGEVVVRAYGGQWTTHESAPGAFAISVNGSTGFPFGAVERVLTGEPFKSLAGFARVFPVIAQQAGPSD